MAERSLSGKTLLVTGGSGFIGSNLIHYWLRRFPGCRVINLDLLTYAGNPENLASVEAHPRYRFVRGDVADPEVVDNVFEAGVDRVIHFAAESHVDRSIHDSTPFLRTNVLGTQILLDAARKHEITRFLLVSTDEVYGSIAEGAAHEESPLAPNSPYAASKTSADGSCDDRSNTTEKGFRSPRSGGSSSM